MAISAALVKELRERTGLGMMECKNALTDVNGDIEQAIEALRKSGQAKAAKKAGRIAAEGIIYVKINDKKNQAVILEVNCETDFASRDTGFQDFVKNTAQIAFNHHNITIEELKKQLESERQSLIQKIGENITIRRLMHLNGPIINTYTHGNNRIAVIVALDTGTHQIAHDIAMHIAATNPEVIQASDMPHDMLEKEKDIFKAQALESGKPADIIDKMIAGRIKKFLSENSLVEQAFVKNPEQTIAQLLTQHNASIQQFVRYEVGEGIAKEVVDFAAEVREQAGL
ncbi:MAG: elongation factor Ts [Endozoicomonadaceae bacterium]|nr:elongation factor Ts [Endozoicomonadaceae bacterium]